MLTHIKYSELADPLHRRFVEAAWFVGYRVRTNHRVDDDVAENATGTVLAVTASPKTGVFLIVAWDCLIEKQRWYHEEVLLRNVILQGAPVRRPVPTRRGTREFTVKTAFGRIGREVWAARPPVRAVALGQAGRVTHVVADEHRLMVAVFWVGCAEDWTWLSRAECDFYLSDEEMS